MFLVNSVIAIGEETYYRVTTTDIDKIHIDIKDKDELVKLFEETLNVSGLGYKLNYDNEDNVKIEVRDDTPKSVYYFSKEEFEKQKRTLEIDVDLSKNTIQYVLRCIVMNSDKYPKLMINERDTSVYSININSIENIIQINNSPYEKGSNLRFKIVDNYNKVCKMLKNLIEEGIVVRESNNILKVYTGKLLFGEPDYIKLSIFAKVLNDEIKYRRNCYYSEMQGYLLGYYKKYGISTSSKSIFLFELNKEIRDESFDDMYERISNYSSTDLIESHKVKDILYGLEEFSYSTSFEGGDIVDNYMTRLKLLELIALSLY